jgi:hypothetical protein
MSADASVAIGSFSACGSPPTSWAPPTPTVDELIKRTPCVRCTQLLTAGCARSADRVALASIARPHAAVPAIVKCHTSAQPSPSAVVQRGDRSSQDGPVSSAKCKWHGAVFDHFWVHEPPLQGHKPRPLSPSRTMLPFLLAAAAANAIHPDLELIRFGDNTRYTDPQIRFRGRMHLIAFTMHHPPPDACVQ